MHPIKPATTYKEQVEKLRSRGCIIENNEIDTLIKKQENKELFVDHHIEKYGGKFPIWVIIELFSFGNLSRFYADMPWKSQKEIAATFYNCHKDELSSWLHSCSILRNICAHFGRLYFRSFRITSKGLLELEAVNNRSFFAALLVLKSLFPETDKWNNEVFIQIKNLLTEYYDDIEFRHIGFPPDWQDKLKR